MAYHPFFDAQLYPWTRADAKAMHRALSLQIQPPKRIWGYYEDCVGSTESLTSGLAADLAWKEVLNFLVTAKALRQLCDQLLADKQLAALHDAVRAVYNAEDVVPRPILPNNTLFLDRKNLRAELETLSQPDASGVLLVRGASGGGNTWTRELIKVMAADRGVSCLCLYAGIVSNVRSVVDQLFTVLGDRSQVPPVTQTDPAWYQHVCLTLQELAEKKGRFLWVVADDLKAAQIDPEIRVFFDQFGLNMANPPFAQRFRLVLIDYPQGKLPTRWSVWSEDRPHENDIDSPIIADFLLKWAEHKQKNLDAKRAAELADGILVKIATPPPPDFDGDPRRLPRIHAELKAMLKTL